MYDNRHYTNEVLILIEFIIKNFSLKLKEIKDENHV